MRREADFARHDFLVDLDGLIGKEGRIAGSHFEHKYTQGPPVHGFIVSFRQDDLGSEVFGGAAQRPRPSLHSLRKTKVSNLPIHPKNKTDIRLVWHKTN